MTNRVVLAPTEEERQRAVQSILTKRRYNREHAAEITEQQRQYYQEHKDEIVAHQRQYYQEHKDERTKYDRQHYQERPEVRKASIQKRRAKIAGSGGQFNAEEFRLLCESYGNRCAYCKQKLPLGPDHVVPLSRGGSNSIDNIVPACTSCNAKKCAKTYDEFIEELG